MVNRTDFHTSSYDHVMSSSKIEMEEKDIEFVAKLPKIELHLHLDGSLSPGKFQRATCVRNQKPVRIIVKKPKNKHVYLAKVNVFLEINNNITSSC